ncbi:hypothetical protein [Streptomyces cinnamoneus]|uniref:hypothetical protein n=1 Tax=Streptomyces cinnamoneus TaxID=53446 RepID=UPI001865A14B|nr:hypothetical protein [Streptomyces cinnamoneus]
MSAYAARPLPLPAVYGHDTVALAFAAALGEAMARPRNGSTVSTRCSTPGVHHRPSWTG